MGAACSKDDVTMSGNQDKKNFVSLEKIVCKNDDLAEGEMKEIQMNDENEKPPMSVILVKHKGQISAIGNKCTHYGAPLIKGSYSNDNCLIRCPWHGACFNAMTGDIEVSSVLTFDKIVGNCQKTCVLSYQLTLE